MVSTQKEKLNGTYTKEVLNGTYRERRVKWCLHRKKKS